MDAKKPSLTARQRRFVEEYAAEGVAVQAYFRAFGRTTSKGKRRSYQGAAKASKRLLQNDLISAEIEAAQAAFVARSRVSKLRVIREAAALAFSDQDDLYEPDPDNGGLPRPRPWDQLSPTARKAIQSVRVRRKRLASDKDGTAWEVEEVEYKLYSKTDALEKLCRKLGLYDAELKGLAEELAELGKQFRERNREQPAAGGDKA